MIAAAKAADDVAADVAKLPIDTLDKVLSLQTIEDFSCR